MDALLIYIRCVIIINAIRMLLDMPILDKLICL